MQAIDMSPGDMEDAARSGHLADDLHCPDRRCDLDGHDVAIDQTNLDRYGGAVQHIRDPRTDGKGSEAGSAGQVALGDARAGDRADVPVGQE